MQKRYTVIITATLMLLIACAPVDLPETETPTTMPEQSPVETTIIPTSTPSPTEVPSSHTEDPSAPLPAPLEPYMLIMPDTALLSETPRPVLEAYYEEIKTAVDKYGYGDGFNGVVYADFVDLDNDGIPELIYIYGDGIMDGTVEVKIYGYSGGLVLHTSYLLYPTHTNEVRKATRQDGLSYLTYSDVSDLDGFDEYYSIVNGMWTLALELYWNRKDEIAYEEPGIDDDLDLWRDVWNEYYVNGNYVNWESYRNAPEMELGITSERTLWNWWGYMGEDYVYNSADDWHIDITEYWNTVPIVLAALESLIEAA